MPPSQLQIKSSALQRLIKDKHLYKEEIKEHEQVIADLKKKLESTGTPEEKEEATYSLRNYVKIKEETERLVPSINGKISQVLAGLKEYLAQNEGESDEATKKLISEAKKELKSQ